jgi:hypothetical protein
LRKNILDFCAAGKSGKELLKLIETPEKSRKESRQSGQRLVIDRVQHIVWPMESAAGDGHLSRQRKDHVI